MTQPEQSDSLEPVDIEYAWSIARGYGFDTAGTMAEVKAYAQVLDRMGSFASWERAALDRAGWLR